MGQFCQPNKTPDGQATAWGTMEPADLFGPEGWCTAEKPKARCECFLDGWGGATCEDPYEQVGAAPGGLMRLPGQPWIASGGPWRATLRPSPHRCVPVQFCFNQCNGRGECNLGYCKCDKGERVCGSGTSCLLKDQVGHLRLPSCRRS